MGFKNIIYLIKSNIYGWIMRYMILYFSWFELLGLHSIKSNIYRWIIQ